jgi:DNA repair protein RadC
LHAGAQNLSNAELLAIILRTGGGAGNVLDLANRLLAHFESFERVTLASVDELCRVKDVGQVKAIELKAAFELGKRAVSLDPTSRHQISSPRDVFTLVGAEMQALGQEHLRVLMLNTKNQVVRSRDVYHGSLNTIGVRVGELFREAIRENSSSMVLVHNHPSGDPTPSAEDVNLTREAVQAGRLLDIELLDHVIIGLGEPGFVSLKERGLGFGPDGRGG